MEVITIESKAYQEMINRLEKIENSVSINQDENPIEPIEKKEWITSGEVCGMLNISYRTLARMRECGSIDYSVFNKRAMYRIKDIQKVIRKNRKKSTNP